MIFSVDIGVVFGGVSRIDFSGFPGRCDFYWIC